jgi:glucose-6-phosphate dehydrogenase assembly protein OpcA
MLREARVAALEAARPVDPRVIERELSTLWKQAAEPLDDWPDDEQPPIVRAAMLNLVAVAESEAAATAATDAVRVLLERHPMRAVVLQMRPDVAHEGVEAMVQAHCHLPTWSRSYICGEQISLVVQGREAVRHVRGNLLPLLITDLPTVLWWPGAPFAHPLVGRLAELSDQFVVDSTSFPDLVAGLSGLLAIVDQPGLQVDCRDLSWARITPWRSLIAQFFDSPNARPVLDAINYVTITYRADGGDTPRLAQPLLVAAWLASRQGWALDSSRNGQAVERRGERLLLHLRGQAHAVTVDLRPDDERAVAPGSVVSVRLQVRGSEPRAEFSVACLDDPAFVLTLAQQGGRQPVPRVTKLSSADAAHLLSAELDLPRHDSTLIGALRVAVPFAEAIAGHTTTGA